MGDQDGSFPIEKEDIEYNSVTNTYRVEYESEASSRPTNFVVQFVATLCEEPVSDIPQINKYIHPDGFNALLTKYTVRHSDVEVSFTYAGYRITVNESGEIRAQPITEE